MMNPDTKVTRSDKALGTPIDDELVMFDSGAGKYYGLNEVATEIWRHLEQSITVDELCARLTADFDLSRDECLADVLPFLEKLKERGLVKVSDD
ncbi:HPr-rel-A system PqqD family peptide chaperone [Balneolales bacterium ANBcel1]|nr:HPr-rel-A system PqqD family peptide chaperone [Balneolales bacterium ANBcel1]